MLIRFSVKNHLSLRDTQELSFVASSIKDDDTGLISTAALPQTRLLPAIVIYGANASGKSNVVEALEFMQSSVLLSQVSGSPGGGIPRQAFAFDSVSNSIPSIFDIEFVVNEQRYRYGFEASDEEFLSEWLYSFPNGRQTRLFVRSGLEFEFGRSFTGRNRAIQDLTRPNSLFLSAAYQNNHARASEIVSFFDFPVLEREFNSSFVDPMSLDKSGQIDKRCFSFLDAIGTGVVSAQKSSAKMTNQQKQLNDGMLELFKQTMPDIAQRASVSGPFDMPRFKLGHRGDSEKVHFLSLQRESSGTRRLLNLLGVAFKILDTGNLVSFDELDASLHTKASEALISLFNNQVTNQRNAQLLATVHDTNLLKSDLLRRDQVWFTEKDAVGATSLYPLTDIATRQGDNIEKGYLQGRYGAIPYSGDVSALLASIG